jgi:hypothetical protein
VSRSNSTCVQRIRREVVKLGFRRRTVPLLKPRTTKKEENSSGFGIIKLRTVYNFCTAEKRFAKGESARLKVRETTCLLRCGEIWLREAPTAEVGAGRS